MFNAQNRDQTLGLRGPPIHTLLAFDCLLVPSTDGRSWDLKPHLRLLGIPQLLEVPKRCACRRQVEADSYWCLCKLLDGIQDHYTYAQPGIQRTVFRLKELVRRARPPRPAFASLLYAPSAHVGMRSEL